MLRQEKLFSENSEMGRKYYKRRIKLHIHRVTAVICSGLLVFGNGSFYAGGFVHAAAGSKKESVKKQSEKRLNLLHTAELCSQKGIFKDLLLKRTEKWDFQFKEYANEWRKRERTYKIPVEQEEKSAEILLVNDEWYAPREQMQELENNLRQLLEDADGTWSIYVKDLQTEVSFSINNEEMYAASLIKLFVMEKCFADYWEIITNDMEISADNEASTEYIETLLKGMIEVSDNESFNELVKLQNVDRDFEAGAEEINQYLDTQGYKDTGLYHTLHPAFSEQEWISEEQNHTTVEDCGLLLERIYEGDCVSEKASEEMMELLLNQQLTEKIPAGLPENELVVCANKTGETDSDNHDAAIVFGSEKDYVLCIMSSEWGDSNEAVAAIQEISKIVYETLNHDE